LGSREEGRSLLRLAEERPTQGVRACHSKCPRIGFAVFATGAVLHASSVRPGGPGRHGRATSHPDTTSHRVIAQVSTLVVASLVIDHACLRYQAKPGVAWRGVIVLALNCRRSRATLVVLRPHCLSFVVYSTVRAVVLLLSLRRHGTKRTKPPLLSFPRRTERSVRSRIVSDGPASDLESLCYCNEREQSDHMPPGLCCFAYVPHS
jgi:hypothetical protein